MTEKPPSLRTLKVQVSDEDLQYFAQFRQKELNGDTVASLFKLVAQMGRLLDDCRILNCRAEQIEEIYREFFNMPP